MDPVCARSNKGNTCDYTRAPYLAQYPLNFLLVNLTGVLVFRTRHEASPIRVTTGFRSRKSTRNTNHLRYNRASKRFPYAKVSQLLDRTLYFFGLLFRLRGAHRYGFAASHSRPRRAVAYIGPSGAATHTSPTSSFAAPQYTFLAFLFFRPWWVCSGDRAG